MKGNFTPKDVSEMLKSDSTLTDERHLHLIKVACCLLNYVSVVKVK